MKRIAYALAPVLVLSAPRAWAQDDPDTQPGAQRIGDPIPQNAARVIVPPKLTKFVEAEYPAEEKAANKQATAVLQIAVTDKGTVAAVVVLESAGAAFDTAAVAAARQFVFEPARVNGKAIPVKITYRYEFVQKIEQVKRTTADFVGLVRERGSKKPIAGVKVALETGQSAITDDQGRFTIAAVEPGEHTIALSGEKLTQIGTQETFEPGKQLDATYDVELKASTPGEDDSDFEIVVTAPRIAKQLVSTEITATEARKVPGTQGDVLKVVENLPGVARTATGSGALVVWGTAPEDTRVYVEGMRIPRLYHDGGYRSVIHSDFVRSVELVPGGYGAQYGRGLGGLVTVWLRPMDDERIHGSVAADLLDASASLRGPIGKKLHFQAAIRRSHLSDLVRLVGQSQVEDIVPLPQYYDGQVRLSYDLAENERLEAGGLFSYDSTRRTLVDPDPTQTKRETKSLGFFRVWARYEKKTKAGEVITVLPSFGQDHGDLDQRFGPIPTGLTTDANVFGLRATYRAQPAKWLGVTVGLDAELSQSALRRSGSITTPAREGDVRVFGQAPSDAVNVDRWHTVIGSFAPFGELDASFFGDKVHVIPGVRLDPYLMAGDRSVPVTGDKPAVGWATQSTPLEPRVAVRWQATRRVLAKAALGLYHQPPLAEDLSAVFGNPKLGLGESKHALLGGVVKLTGSLSAEVTGFYEWMDGLTSRSTSSTPLLAQALVQQGAGRSFGVQLLLRQEQWGPFFGWISYSIIRSERKDAPDREWRPFDYDQSHALTAVGALDLGKGWEVGARVRFATGFPRTPVVDATYNSKSDAWDPVFGPQNASRIPAFFQLDVRGAKKIKIAKTDLEIYVDVQNVINRANPEEVVYDYRYAKKAYITGLPVLPVVGVSWNF